MSQKLASIPVGLNDRLMSMHLPLGKKTSATIISAYAPTMTNPDEVKDKFYEELDSLIVSSKSEKLIILDPKKLQDFQEHMHNHLADLQLNQSSIEDQWATFRDAVHSVALECLGPATRYHQDWFDENDTEIQELLDTKHNLLRLHRNDPSSMAKKAAFTKARSKVQAKLRYMKDSWLSAKADQIQSFADRNDIKNFYDALKAVYGPKPSHKKLILERWAEHFNNVLNQPAQINNEAIIRLPHVPINHKLEVPPSKKVIDTAITQLSSGKAPGSDSMPAEVYKKGGPITLIKLAKLY
ncbi:uncharacterized protein [Diadema antillarum]|uniref:uncharacterized protein n=1 Tax=Diadema antillarum TaxID=105358 RepID=UPI003A8A8957